jgi:hypothetical protein
LTRPATLTGNGAAAISLRERKSMDTSRFLILLGLAICAVGLFWPIISKLGLGRLPGDIVVERDGYSFYFPFTTGLIISAFISVLWWLLSR